MATADKAPDAFRTIGELSAELGVAQHILRYWETRFPQLKPLQRAGNRRYYRAADVALARRIHDLLANQGYTVRGVQKVLGDRSAAQPILTPSGEGSPPLQPAAEATTSPSPSLDVDRLTRLRDRLAEALSA